MRNHAITIYTILFQLYTFFPIKFTSVPFRSPVSGTALQSRGWYKPVKSSDMFLFNYFRRREKGAEKNYSFELTALSLSLSRWFLWRKSFVFSRVPARPPIFTIFDITRVFIKVTLIKSRSRSFGRNNNFFSFSFRFSDRRYTGNRRKILREKAGEARIRTAVRPVFRAGAIKVERWKSMEITLFIEKHYPPILTGRNPRVLREWIESTYNLLSRHATRDSTAMRHTRCL